MTQLFYAENIQTGERWAPPPGSFEWLVLDDIGQCYVVRPDLSDKMVGPLNTAVWRVVINMGGCCGSHCQTGG